MFFKRLSRSRTNSQSYVDEDFEHDRPHSTASHPQPIHSGPLESSAINHHPEQQHHRPPSSYRSPVPYSQHDLPATQGAVPDHAMYNARNSHDGRPSHDGGQSNYAPPSSSRPAHANTTNGTSMTRGSSGLTRDSGYGDDVPSTPMKHDHHPTPDPLARAFNDAIRPYHEKIEALESQLADMQGFVEQMEQQRMDIFAWIDKRGLRPDVPPAIAKQMDSTPEAAAALNAQLDRKITIVNFDLHRLQDDLNDSISSAHFASAMAKFLPDVHRLASISGGPRFAYELIIKLVGNLNSHGGLEAGAGGTDAELDEDRRARSAFYTRMDDELLAIIRRRNAENEEWAIAREVKRLEKNGAYLKNLGIDSYFPRSLETMRQETSFRGGSGTPPRY